MESLTDSRFWEAFRQLPKEIPKQAYKAHAQFERDPFSPGLNFEEVNKKRHLWSARVARGYRALAIRDNGKIT